MLVRLLEQAKRIARALRVIRRAGGESRQGVPIVAIKAVVQFQRSGATTFHRQTHDTFALRPGANTTSKHGARRKLTVVWRGSTAFGVPNRYPAHETFDTTGGAR